MKVALIVLGVIGLLILLVGGCSYFTIPSAAASKQEATFEALGDVAADEQRRYDLVPNLVETVKAYASHEREVLTAVTEARAKVGQLRIDPSTATPEQIAAWQRAQGDFTSALSKLMLIVENYPQLKANENFLALQAQLEGTENRLAVSRKRYNTACKDYNSYIRNRFNKIFVSESEFARCVSFEAGEGAKKAPKVDFKNK